jgi:pSer/pThr/pTyr-binding forkhead associated (FHA) protein
MSPFVIAVLKYVFLALLYFFVFRAIRAVAHEVSGRGSARAVSAGETRQLRQPSGRGGKGRGGKGKPPTTVVVKGEDGRKVQSLPLRDTLQVGRADACHVQIDDRYASQFHARLYPKNGSWYVEDLGSTNGTYLNRQRLTGHAEVHAGDVVRIGKTTLELKR